MRLLHTKTGEFREITDPTKVRYAILSHVWSQAGELSYQDVEHIRRTHCGPPSISSIPFLSRLPEKIRCACRLALADGFSYIWIDTCCIDKTSSAELSEALNSMYQWYASAAVCYAYLEDVKYSQQGPYGPSIAKCRWFTRVWTLQELIAPRILVFVGPNWIPFGSKDSYCEEIVTVTHIPEPILLHLLPVDSVCVATRMSWASHRETTRVEDQAYCLMGIFGVYMPTIYGEQKHAFRRLQEEILKHDPDHTILVDSSTTVPIDDSSWDWAYTARLMACTMTPGRRPRQPLAESSKSFRPSRSRSIHMLSPGQLAQRLRMSATHTSLLPQISVVPDGIRLRIPIVHIGDSLVAGFLACEHRIHNSEPQLVVLLLSPPSRNAPCLATDGLHYFIYGLYSVRALPPAEVLVFRDVCLGLPETLSRYQRYYLPSPIPAAVPHVQGEDYIPAECRLFLQQRHYGSYVLASCTVGREKCDKSWGERDHPSPTYTFMFSHTADPFNRIHIRLGPCHDDCFFTECWSRRLQANVAHSHSHALCTPSPSVGDTVDTKTTNPRAESVMAPLGPTDAGRPVAHASSSWSRREHDGRVVYSSTFVCSASESCVGSLGVTITFTSWWKHIHARSIALPPTYTVTIDISSVMKGPVNDIEQNCDL